MRSKPSWLVAVALLVLGVCRLVGVFVAGAPAAYVRVVFDVAAVAFDAVSGAELLVRLVCRCCDGEAICQKHKRRLHLEN